MVNDTNLREDVRRHYAEAAGTVTGGLGAASDCCHAGTTCAEEDHATGRGFYARTDRGGASRGRGPCEPRLRRPHVCRRSLSW